MKKKTKNEFVTTTNQLLNLIEKNHYNYAVLLAGGLIYSRKTIHYNKKTNKFIVINHVDESIQKLTETELLDDQYTNIGKAMPLNSLIAIIK